MGLTQEMRWEARDVGTALGQVVLDELEGEGCFGHRRSSSSLTLGRIAQTISLAFESVFPEFQV